MLNDDGTLGSITVLDRGLGVSPQDLARIKEPFFRVDSARNLDEGGAGLGLSIVDNLTRIYGGGVEISNLSDMPSGLSVCVWLPLAYF